MLFCLSANHRNTEFEVLERVAQVDGAVAEERLSQHEFVRGAVVLSTCNRFEAYLDIDEPVTGGPALAREAVLDALAALSDRDALALRESAAALTGDDVVHHLFSVSSGLESMVLGEDEIVGQVQRALVAARGRGTTTPGLEQVFQRAAHATRDVRAAADLGAAGRSLVRIALDMAATRVTDWSQTRILVVGTGQYAATTIAALRDRGADDITVFSATGRAERFAARYGIRAAADLRDGMGEADIVITCTARYVVTADEVPDRRARLMIDLGLPRNIDPSVGGLPGVELLDLELIGKHASLPELAGAGAQRVVGAHAVRFAAERDAAPGIVAVRTHIQAALDAELARLRPDDPASEATAAALRHLAGVLSHTPSVRAREFAASGRTEEFEAALEMVFGLRVERPDEAARGDIDRAAG